MININLVCTHYFQMQWTFYHNQIKTNAFHWDLETNAIENAITLHPMKNPAYMYRIHLHFSIQKLLEVQHTAAMKINTLQNLNTLHENGLAKKSIVKIRSKRDLNQHVRLNSTLSWELFSPKNLYSIESSSKMPIAYSIKKSINSVLRQTLAKINQEARNVIHRELVLSKMNLGYVRLSPTQGLQYIFDLRMATYQHIAFNKRKLPINVQYQAHVQNPFGNMIYTSLPTSTRDLPTVNIILPLAGRLEAFTRYLANFERTVLLTNENVKLLIVYFHEKENPTKHKQILQSYINTYPRFDVKWKTVDGNFSRGLALQLGVAQFSDDSLLFFCDVDLAFDKEFLQRCRLNTALGKRVFYPIVFSQFNQNLLTKSKQEERFQKRQENEIFYPDDFKGNNGFWRQYGFGIMCVYGKDMNTVGGFDLKIKGWGMEDVLLYKKFLTIRKYDILRVPDPGLLHIYHQSSCSPDLDPVKLKSCHNSALSELASTESLVDYMKIKKYI